MKGFNAAKLATGFAVVAALQGCSAVEYFVSKATEAKPEAEKQDEPKAEASLAASKHLASNKR